jgi:hypothetical protein
VQRQHGKGGAAVMTGQQQPALQLASMVTLVDAVSSLLLIPLHAVRRVCPVTPLLGRDCQTRNVLQQKVSIHTLRWQGVACALSHKDPCFQLSHFIVCAESGTSLRVVPEITAAQLAGQLQRDGRVT